MYSVGFDSRLGLWLLPCSALGGTIERFLRDHTEEMPHAIATWLSQVGRSNTQERQNGFLDEFSDFQRAVGPNDILAQRQVACQSFVEQIVANCSSCLDRRWIED